MVGWGGKTNGGGEEAAEHGNYLWGVDRGVGRLLGKEGSATKERFERDPAIILLLQSFR